MRTHQATHHGGVPRHEGALDTYDWTRALLMCGVAASTYYAAMTAYVTMQANGYSSMSQAVSELSAIDAPTRALWVALGIPYTMLVMAFGFGIMTTAGKNRALRAVGALYVVQASIGAFWPPMHLRGAEPTLTDTLHLVWTGAWLVAMVIAMGLAAAVLGRHFRIYTLATLSVFVVFGVLTGMEATRLAAGLSTPFLGLWERVNMGAGMLWTAVLAWTLLKRDGPARPAERAPTPRPASSS